MISDFIGPTIFCGTEEQTNRVASKRRTDNVHQQRSVDTQLRPSDIDGESCERSVVDEVCRVNQEHCRETPPMKIDVVRFLQRPSPSFSENPVPCSNRVTSVLYPRPDILIHRLQTLVNRERGVGYPTLRRYTRRPHLKYERNRRRYLTLVKVGSPLLRIRVRDERN